MGNAPRRIIFSVISNNTSYVVIASCIIPASYVVIAPCIIPASPDVPASYVFPPHMAFPPHLAFPLVGNPIAQPGRFRTSRNDTLESGETPAPLIPLTSG